MVHISCRKLSEIDYHCCSTQSFSLTAVGVAADVADAAEFSAAAAGTPECKNLQRDQKRWAAD